MAGLAPHDYFGRAVAFSACIHALVAALVWLRPFGQTASVWQLPDAVDVGIVTAGDVADLGGGAAAAGPKQMAQTLAPSATPAEPESKDSSEAEQIISPDEPEAVPVAPVPPKAPDKPKPVVKPKPESTAKKSTSKATDKRAKAQDKAKATDQDAGPGKSTSTGSASPSASSALSSIMAKYQKPEGRGDGKGMGGNAGGQGGVGTSGIASNFYHRTLVARIRQFWNVPPGVDSDGLATILALVISRDGVLESVNLVKSSGDRLFDASAEKAVHAAAPYNPIPQSIPAPFRVEVRLIPENRN